MEVESIWAGVEVSTLGLVGRRAFLSAGEQSEVIKAVGLLILQLNAGKLLTAFLTQTANWNHLGRF